MDDEHLFLLSIKMEEVFSVRQVMPNVRLCESMEGNYEKNSMASLDRYPTEDVKIELLLVTSRETET